MTLEIKKTTCPKCSIICEHRQADLKKARCQRCGARLYEFPKLEVHVVCADPDCRWVNRNLPAFGWKVKACGSCGNQITHPATKSRGAHLKGNAKNAYHFNLKLPQEDHDKIEEISKEMGTTKAAIARFMTRIVLDML